MSPARRGTRPHIGTVEILEAVAVLGVRWTLLFSDWEIVPVNEALDRELLDGNLANAFTLSPQGRDLLDRETGADPRPTLDLRVVLECRDHDGDCWTITCTRCRQLRTEHVAEADVRPTVQKIIADHVCTGHVRVER